MRLISIVLAVLAVVLFSQVANSDDAPKRSAELQVLDRFVGTWDFVVTNKLTGGETITGKTFETRRWTLGNKFVQGENPKTEKPDEPEFQMLVTYDPATQEAWNNDVVPTFRSLEDLGRRSLRQRC